MWQILRQTRASPRCMRGSGQACEMRSPSLMFDRRNRSIAYARISIIVGIITLWEGLVRIRVLDQFFFSRPSAVLRQIYAWLATGTIWQHVRATAMETILS